MSAKSLVAGLVVLGAAIDVLSSLISPMLSDYPLKIGCAKTLNSPLNLLSNVIKYNPEIQVSVYRLSVFRIRPATIPE